MEYRVKAKAKCVYQNVLYAAGEEFIFQAEKKSDLPDYVQVISESTESGGTEESTESTAETEQTTTEQAAQTAVKTKNKNKK